MKKVEGKIALVTGGGRGLGEGIVMSLAREGADVVVADILIEEARAVVEKVKKLGRRGLAVQVDVTKLDQVEAMLETIVKEMGTLDIAVNNAGVLGTAALTDMTEQEWDRVMTVNAKGAFLCVKTELKYFLAKGEGRIINISSIAGKMGVPMLAHYCASKFAVLGLTNAAAKEVASTRITVNAICPGIIGTDMWLGEKGLANVFKGPDESQEQSWKRNLAAFIPQGVAQTPEDMGDAVVYLAAAEHVTGQALNVDGGACFP
ncbi:MAG: SDR family NAD(P)-dependent oxidoreductase [Pseudomonadota bacterium]